LSGSSYRTILRSSSIVGGAQAINILVSLVKMKFVAVLLGPAGVGLLGLYMNLIQTAAAVASLGIGNVGTRQIASAQASGGNVAVGNTRRALFWGTVALVIAGSALFWLTSGFVARVVLGDGGLATDVAWLSLGVGLTIASGSQGAILAGLRRIGDLARINVASGLAGALVGVLALWLWGAHGLIPMLLAAPAATFVVGYIYVHKLGRPAGKRLRLPEMLDEWRVMVTLGFAFMLSGVVATLSILAVRALVQRQLGSDALGQFQAAWAIGMTYLGFVLGAMGTDYYPRLNATIDDRVATAQLVNEQTEVALLLCGPALLAMLGLSPWVIHLLYSPAFAPAVEILRWQLLGDILKVMSWPLSYVILAVGAGRTFVLTETLANGVFVLGVLFGLPLIGVRATGAAFLALYACYLPLVWWLGGRRIDFRWTTAVRLMGLAIFTAAVAVNVAAWWSELLGAALGVVLALALGVFALVRLSMMAGAGGTVGKVIALGKRIQRWTTRPP
jgi:O-antigen/teichoic acid export membrane protein